MKNCIFSLLLLILATPSSATHIVGGSMTHQSLGNNEYLIQVEIFRDCFNGIPYFDNPLSIGVFDENHQLVQSHLIPLDFNNVDTVSILPDHFVCVFPEDICISKAVYATTITLPAGNGKYTVSHQRCCRTHILSNLINPDDVGMTFMTVIDNSLVNSSPIFNQDIPFAIFSNVPFIYDGSATDPDGDSLVYSLSTPFSGGVPTNPMPQPPSPPPYVPANFLDPPYSVSNMLGGDYPLVINSATGEFSAIPITTGAFQIAYKVDEYRNGELIGTTYREFIFVVVPPESSVNFDVSGRVMIDSLTPLDAGTVELFQRDVTTDSLHLYSTYQVTAGGEYAFFDIPPGVFYFRGKPDTSSIYHGSHLPTYFRNSLFWYEAIPVNQCDTVQYYRDIYLVPADSFITGFPSHQLKGTVYNAADGETVPNLNLLLADFNLNFFQSATTDGYGRFSFNAPQADYLIYVDLWNSAIDNSNPPVVPINTGQPEFAIFHLHPDRLELVGFTNTKERRNIGVLDIWPNPSNGNVTVYLPSALIAEQGELAVWNIAGTLVTTRRTEASATVQLELPAGFFFITFTTVNGVWTGKVEVR